MQVSNAGRNDGPRPTIAASLDSASAGELVYVDRGGSVLAPKQVRRRQLINGVVAGGAVTLGLTVSALYTPWMMIPYALVGVRMLYLRRVAKRFTSAVALLQVGRSAEARALLLPIASGRWGFRQMRVAALMRLSTCDFLDELYDESLRKKRLALSMMSPRSIQFRVARYAEVATLVALQRSAEARAVLVSIGATPTAEFLLVLHWTCELNVALLEKRHGFSDDELHERMRKALAMTRGSELLLLCAWAYEQQGDREQADFLVEQATDRMAEIQRGLLSPSLRDWIDARPPLPPRSDDD